MRDQDQPQEVSGLGRKIVKPCEPKPDQKVREGIFKSPDGRMYTQLPDPPAKL